MAIACPGAQTCTERPQTRPRDKVANEGFLNYGYQSSSILDWDVPGNEPFYLKVPPMTMESPINLTITHPTISASKRAQEGRSKDDKRKSHIRQMNDAEPGSPVWLQKKLEAMSPKIEGAMSSSNIGSEAKIRSFPES